MAYFLHRLNGPRPEFPHDISEKEKLLMEEHVRYWRALALKGTAIAVGPVMDPVGVWGVAIVEVPQEVNARDIAAADPVILAEAGFSYDIFPIPQLILRK